MKWLLLGTALVAATSCSKKPTPPSGLTASASAVASVSPKCTPWPANGLKVKDATANSDGSPRTLPPGPDDLPGKTLTLRYADFGPQAAATRLLGTAWWSWASGGCYQPSDAFDVRVVVYRDIDKSQVAKRYPTTPGQSDYRLISDDAARAYLTKEMSTITDADGPGLQNLRSELGATVNRLDVAFAKPGKAKPKGASE